MMNMVKEMIIETNRLIIRPFKEDDLLVCFKLMQDKELFKYLNMAVMSLDKYKGLFNWLIDSYNKGFDEDFKYCFNITLKESGTHIGWCGIGGIDYDHEQKEIYYLIGREYWGNGYAKEATVALRDYCFQTIGLNEIVALCKPDNISSKKIIENMGFKYRYKIEGLPKEHDFYNGELYYSLTKEEYTKIINNEDTTYKNIFEIDCKDVVLREFKLEDLDELQPLTEQHEITDFVSDWDGPKENHRHWIANWVMKENTEFAKEAHNIQRHILRLGIILKETNQLIGWICSGVCDELPPPNREIGYAISKDYRCKGYTTQAVQGLIKYLFEETNIEDLTVIALTYNIPSNKVIQKCGFKFINNIDIKGKEFYHYTLSKSEWKNKE